MLDPALVAAAQAKAGPLEDYSMRDRVVVVTGGGRGLGAAICGVLGADGARIVIGEIDFERGHERATALSTHGIDAVAMPLDVGDESQVQAFVERVRDRYGRVDVVINNAAIDVTVPIAEMPAANWDRELRTNLTGPFLMVKYTLPHLKRGGHVINIASTAAKRTWPNAAAYHATKWGLLGFSHALHSELRGSGIKVTAIIAGGMRTPFLLDRFPDIDTSTLQDPIEVAKTVHFVLTQPHSSVIPEVMVLPMAESSWP